MRKAILLYYIFMSLCGVIFCSKPKTVWPKEMVVTVPVANVRSQPRDPKKLTYEKLEWGQTSQVLFGERVLAFRKKGRWLEVRALEQKITAGGKWYSLPGWIKSNAVREVKQPVNNNLIVTASWATIYDAKGKKKNEFSLGTKLYGVRCDDGRWWVMFSDKDLGFVDDDCVRSLKDKDSDTDAIRKSIIKTAKSFLGSPYHWGGRSFYNPKYKRNNVLTGVDCSSFTELCYKVHGIYIPRNTVSQYMRSKKLNKAPNKGDLVFIATYSRPESIKHVLLYMGYDKMIEARGDPKRKVCITTGKERLGKSIEELKSGDKTSEGTIYFGSFL